jgi:hypothetical protein
MKSLLIAGAYLVMAMVYALAFDDQRKDAPQTSLAREVNQLEKEYRARAAELRKEMRERMSAEPEKFVKAFREYKLEAGKKFLELARKDPQDPASFKALKLAFSALEEQPAQKEVLELFAKHHLERAGIGDIAVSFAYDDDANNLSFAEAVLRKNANREDQAKAQFAIGFIYRRRAGQEKGTDEERAEAADMAAKAFELLKSKYGDVKPQGEKSFAEKAAAMLAGLNNVPKLVVGKRAPEIQGEDLDGKSFKLSDYRGKVVLLDFWAHW